MAEFTMSVKTRWRCKPLLLLLCTSYAHALQATTTVPSEVATSQFLPPSSPSPVYNPSPVKPLISNQNSRPAQAIVFTEVRTFSRVAPTLPPSLENEPTANGRTVPEGEEILTGHANQPASLIAGPEGQRQSLVESLKCTKSCSSSKKQGKILKELEDKFNRTESCFCDHDCGEFGDCCPDVLVQTRADWHCLVQSRNPGWVKQSCKRGWNGMDFIVNSCERIDEYDIVKDPVKYAPVTSNISKISYRNIFCAVCNDDFEDTHTWAIRMDGDIEGSVEELGGELFSGKQNRFENISFSESRKRWVYGNIEYRINYVFPSRVFGLRTPHICEELVSTCFDEYLGSELERKCRSDQAVVNNGPKNFKNVYCALCNNITESTKLACGFSNDTSSHIQARIFENGLTLLYDINRGSGQIVGRVTPCDKEEVFDPYYMRCRNVICDHSDYVFRGKKCVSKDQASSIEDEDTKRAANTTQMVFTKKFLDCPRIFLGREDYESLSNGSIYVDKYNITFKPGNYILTETGAYICLFFPTENSIAKFSVYMGYISAIGLGISIACLILHLMIFIVLPEMRNLSGKNLACLSLSLLIAYTSFIAGQLDADEIAGTKGCKVVALITYYFFLASFFWMNSMSFDVWRTLRMATTELRVTTGPQWKRFIFYSIYSWGMTGFIVGLSVVLEHDSSILPSEYRPAFGKHSCWFGHRKALLIFFACPTGVIMLLNLLFFILTAIMIISSTSPSTNIVRDPSSSCRTNFRLYTRLAIMMGLVWMTGLLAGYLDLEVLWYIFIVLNSLQGLFIFIAFSCTKKVMWYFKDKLPDFMKPQVYRSAPTSSTSSHPHSQSTQHSALSRRSSPRSSLNYKHTAPYLIYGAGNNKLDMY